jgi:hypothetical protein
VKKKKKERTLILNFVGIKVPEMEGVVPMKFEIYSRNRWEPMDTEELYKLNEDVALLEKIEAEAWEKAEAALVEAKKAWDTAQEAQIKAVTAAAAVVNKKFRKDRVITLARLFTEETTSEVTKDMKELSELLIEKDTVENELYGMSNELREIYNKCNESTQTSFLPPLNEKTPVEFTNYSSGELISNPIFDNP